MDHLKDTCSICLKGFILSDPKHFDFGNGSGICKDCFLVVLSQTSWAAGREKKIIFEYVKVKIPHALKWQVWKRDEFKCQQCGSSENLSIDHIHPEKLGGGLELQNLQTLCRSHNSKKASKINV